MLERATTGHLQPGLGDLTAHDRHRLEHPVDALVVGERGGEDHDGLGDRLGCRVEELGVHPRLDHADELVVEAIGREVVAGRVDHAQEQVRVAAGAQRLPVGRDLVERLVRQIFPGDDRPERAASSSRASGPSPARGLPRHQRAQLEGGHPVVLPRVLVGEPPHPGRGSCLDEALDRSGVGARDPVDLADGLLLRHRPHPGARHPGHPVQLASGPLVREGDPEHATQVLAHGVARSLRPRRAPIA
uniref:Uncharacterized protein n=1 Tax=Janibacter limosus TaxID=53458 RepID=A0AC61U0U1_9MICO|nr:hypothetical protein [Janibacter limosus]